MPYVAPVCVWAGGDTWDGNSNSPTFAVPVTAGNFVVVSMTTTDSLRNWVTLSGGSVATWYGGGFVADLTDWADAGIWGGWATATGTFNITMTMSGGNAGANYQVMRIYVYNRSDGFGGSAGERKYNNSDVYLGTNGRGGNSAAVWCAVDWDAAGVQGTTQQQGGQQWLDLWIGPPAGAGYHWFGHTDNLASPGSWWQGNYATGNSKVSTLAVEVLGYWLDNTAPTVPTGVTAVANTQSSVTVSWAASTDAEANASGVASYRVRRNGVDIVGATALTGLSYTDTAAKLTDTYTVSAVDNNGNRSGESAVAAVAAPALRLGGTTLTNLKLGSANVDRLYLGASRVFP